MMRYPRLGSVGGQRQAKRAVTPPGEPSSPQGKDDAAAAIADLQAQFAIFVSRTVSQMLFLDPAAEATDESLSFRRILIESVTESVVQEFTSFDDYAVDPRPVIEAVRAKMMDDDLAEIIRSKGMTVSAGDPVSELYLAALTDYQKVAVETRESRSSRERPSPSPGVETVLEEGSSIELAIVGVPSAIDGHVQLRKDASLSPEGPEAKFLVSQRKMILSGSLLDLPELQKRIVRVYLCSSYSGKQCLV